MNRKNGVMVLILLVGALFFVSVVSAYTWRGSGSELMELDSSGNLSVVGDVSASGSGFFGWVGSLVSRVTKLFVSDIDFDGVINGSGNIVTTGNVTGERFDLGGGGYMYDNGTHTIIGHL